MLFPETTQWLPPSSSLRTDGRDRGRRYKQITRPIWYRCTCTKYHRQTNEALQKGSTTQEAWRLLQARPNQLQHGSLSVSQQCKPWVVCTCLGTGHDSGTITPKRGLHKVYDNTVTQRSLHKVQSIRATLGLLYTCLGTSLAGHTLLA